MAQSHLTSSQKAVGLSPALGIADNCMFLSFVLTGKFVFAFVTTICLGTSFLHLFWYCHVCRKR